MNFTRKVIVLSAVFFCFQTYAGELSVDLQKACVNEQLNHHKGIQDLAIEASHFSAYCKCEADYIIKRASKEQLSQITKKQNLKPDWLQQFKSNAFKSCTAKEKKITT